MIFKLYMAPLGSEVPADASLAASPVWIFVGEFDTRDISMPIYPGSQVHFLAATETE